MSLRRTPMIHTAETMIPAKPYMRLLNSNENHNFAVQQYSLRKMKQILHEINRQLAGVFDERELRAVTRVIIEDVLDLSVKDMLMQREVHLNDAQRQRFDEVLGRIADGEPVQYAIGFAWFRGRKMHVNADTLIPRPETAQIVDLILDSNHADNLRVLDIGTGTGCIAICLAAERPSWHIEAWDISQGAVETARRNALDNHVPIDLRCTDLFSTEADRDSYDIIVSNPPYITPSEMSGMEDNVLKHEPHTALFVPQDDPLLFYREIAVKGKKWLSGEGQIYFEINRAYASETVAMLMETGYREAEALRDYNDNYRFVKARI